MKKRSQIKLLVVLSCVVILASCQPAYLMWLVPGSTTDNLIFGWSTTRDGVEKVQPEEIRVFPCATIGRENGGGYYPDSPLAVGLASSPYNALPGPTNRLRYGQGFFPSSSKPLSAPG